MNNWIRRYKFLAITIAALVLLAACGTAAPQQVEVSAKLAAGVLDPATIQVNQDDTVTLKIETDEPGALHLHGYDLEQEVTPGEITEFAFVADASGRYGIAFHPAAEDQASHEHDAAGHGEEFQSEVLHPGDTFSLEVTHEMEGKTISYHSHLHPEVTGSIHVSDDAPAADTVAVEITDGATDPLEVMVRPGTTIIWTNNSTEMQALASGAHPDAMLDGPEDTEHMPVEEEPGHSHEGEVEEIDVGFLEVRPR